MTRRKLLINAVTCIMQKQANTNTLIDADLVEQGFDGGANPVLRLQQ